MLEPSVIVFYVDNLTTSHRFYTELLGIKSIVHSPTYITFTLSNSMVIGLKDKNTQVVNITGNGGAELAFTVDSHTQVDQLFSDWQQQGIKILEQPTNVPYGYTFVAIDPDGNRLRVVSLNK